MRKPTASPSASNRTSQQDSAVAKQELDEWLDEALADTFPASDPIASPPGGGGASDRDDSGETRPARQVSLPVGRR